MKQFRFGLKAKILFGMLFFAGLTLSAIFMLTLYNIGSFGGYLRSACDGLGEKALAGCHEPLRRQAEEELAALVAAQTVITNSFLQRVTDDIVTISELTGRYLTQPVADDDKHQLTNFLRTERPSDIYRYSFIGTTTSQGLSPQFDELQQMSRIHPLLRFIYSNYQEIDQIYLSTDKGFFLAYPWDDLPDDYVVEERSWHREARQSEQPVWVGPYISTMGNRLTITCANVVRDGTGKALGVCAVDIEVKKIIRNFIVNRMMPGAQALLLDRSGNVLARKGLDSRGLTWRETFNRENLLQSTNPVFRTTASRMLAGSYGVEEFSYDGNNYFLAYSTIKATGWRVGVIVEKKYLTVAAANAAMKIQGNVVRAETYIHAAMANNLNINIVTGTVIILLVVFMAMSLSRRITAPVMQLKEKAIAIGRGNFDSGIELHTGDELEKLDVTFDQMVAGIKQYLTSIESTVRERESEQRELEVAAEIQRAMLSSTPLADERVEIESLMRSARVVSGDFYDYFMIDEQCLYLLWGKAHGSGVAAAMQMARIKTLLAHKAAGGVSPDQLLSHINNILSRSHEMNGTSAAVAAALVDLSSGLLQLCNAGNPSPLLIDNTGIKRLGVKNKPVVSGVDMREQDAFALQTVKLSPNSRIFFFTEGAIKVVNPSGERFGVGRLSKLLEGAVNRPGESVVQEVMRELDQFAVSGQLNDDITLISVVYKG